MSRPYTHRDAEDLEVLAGRRGAPGDHAVRRKEINGLVSNIGNTRGINRDTQKAINDVEKAITDLYTADEAINQEIVNNREAAQAAHTAANEITAKHDALVAGFTGTLDDAFTQVDVQITELSAELSDVRAGAGLAPSEYRIITDGLDKLTAGSAAITITEAAGAFGHDGTLTVVDSMAARTTSGTTSGAYAVIPAARAAQFYGRRIRISVLARRLSGYAPLHAAYSAGAAGDTGLQPLGEVTEYEWRWFTGYADVPASTGVTEDHYLGLFADGTTEGRFRIAEINVVVAAEAGPLPKTLKGDVTDILGVKLNGLEGTALGVLMTQLEVDANGTSAKITTQGSAIADLKGNTSAVYGIRVQAGGAASILDMIALDGSGQTPASIVKIGGDDILLDGSVAMEKLTIGLGRNLLPNADFLDKSSEGRPRHWRAGLGVETTFGIRAAGLPWAFPTAPTAALHQNGATASSESSAFCDPESAVGGFDIQGIPAEPGQAYEAQARVSTHRCTGAILLLFYDSAGTEIGRVTEPFGADQSSSTNPLLWPKVWTKAVAPVNAATVRIGLWKYGTLAGSSDSYLFFAQPQVAETHATAIRASQWSPGDTTVIDGGRMFTRSILAHHIGTKEITANETNFGSLGALSLTVDTEDVIRNAVSETYSTATEQYAAGWADAPTWSPYLTYTVTPRTGHLYDAFIWATVVGRDVVAGLFHNGSLISSAYTANINDVGGDRGTGTLVGVARNLSGNQTLGVYCQGDNSSDVPYTWRASMTILLVKK